MEDDMKHPGSMKNDEDGETKTPTLGQSTPFVEGDCSNTQLLYFLLNRKAATRSSNSLAGATTPATASSSSRDFIHSTASLSSRVSMPAMASSWVRLSECKAASSSARISTPATTAVRDSARTAASSSAHVSTPATASYSARAAPPATASSSGLDTQYRFIQEIGSKEKDMHPSNILEALGEDINGEKLLQDHYHFYAWTRYPVNKVVATRNRMTGDTRCWSQGGGKEPVMNDQESIIGWRRKFNFVRNPGKRPIESIKIGSQSYTFKLEELVTVEDEEEEKKMMGEKQTPQSFLSIYRLKPTLKSTNDHHERCRVANPGSDGQISALVLPSEAQPLTGQQDLQLPQTPSLHDSFPDVDSEIDHLLYFFLADEPYKVGIDDLFQNQ